MKILKNWLAGARVRDAKKRLAGDPSARSYAELAHEHALASDLETALKVATEGLRAYPGDGELKRVSGVYRQLALEDRTRMLARELESAPRPALWREMCETLLEAGRLVRAEEEAADWFKRTQSGEAQYYRAKARAERFFADRRRDDGRLAFEFADSAQALLPEDVRPLDLHAQLAARAGVWGEARKDLARLLELQPGNPILESRFRMAIAMFEGPKTVDQALREVERTGRLADEPRDTTAPKTSPSASPEAEESGTAPALARPLLQAIARVPGVQAAFFLRGSTALVQGPKGPTAERTARTVREILHASRGAARRLGLGQTNEVRLEGEFGTLLAIPGELGAGALWIAGEVSRRHEEGLRDLAAAATSAERRP
jgi:tetratricopeptide (TPR) repeat protein